MKRPNVLWYCTDQQRFDTITSLGNPHIQTPNIDRLALRGTAFTQAFCQSTVCTPSRASFLTGMYPSAVSVNQNGVPFFPSHYANRLVSHRFAAEGYHCGLVGKLHLASAAGRQEKRVDDGYHFFEYSHDHKGPNVPGNDYARWLRETDNDPESLLADPIKSEDYAQGAKNESFGGLKEPTSQQDNIPAELHQTRWCTEKALEFMEGSRKTDKPWFLSVNPFDPHPPFDPPWEYYRRFDPDQLPGPHFQESDLDVQKRLAKAQIDFQSEPRKIGSDEGRRIQATYYAMIEQLDSEFGRLLDWLDNTGQAEETIVIFTSDHGEMLGDHGLLLKGCRFYEGLVHVPLIISWPEQFQQGEHSGALVELVDIVPTLYESAGISVPYYVQGRSLGPILRGEARTHRDFVRSECYASIDYPDKTHATMYRDEQWKLVTYHEKDILELYALKSDPWEHNNLGDDPAYMDTCFRLLLRSFDGTVMAHVLDEPRIAPY